MKLNKKITCAAAAILVACGSTMLTGCTKDFEALNTNKYEINPADLPFSSQFIEPLTYVYPPQQNMFQFWTNLSIDLFGGYFMTPHNFGGNGNVDYKLNRGFCRGMYEDYYLHIFNNTRRLIKTYDEKGRPDFSAVLRVVQAYATACATDAYGPIAYKSTYDDNATEFAYEKQEDIYKDIFKLLDDAIDGFKKGTSTPAEMQTFDFWCNGDKQLWIKVANQFKLRYAMRIVKADPVLAKKMAEEAVQGGVLTAADKDIVIDHSLSNELARMFAWGDCGMNANIVTIMDGYQDPRLPLYMTKNRAKVKGKNDSILANTQYLGIRGGCELPNKPNQWGNFSQVVCDYTTPLPVMKVAESYFLRAEGALRGWSMGGNAKDLYNEGIKVSIKNELKYKGSFTKTPVTITDEQIEAYINNGTNMPKDFVDPVNPANNINAMNNVPVKWLDGGTKEQQLDQIITQKWIANFPLSTEAWAEYRRTGYPKLFPNRVNKSDGTISTEEQIRRLIYSPTEINANNAELQKGVELLNQENSSTHFKGDIGGTRVWWDKQNVPNF